MSIRATAGASQPVWCPLRCACTASARVKRTEGTVSSNLICMTALRARYTPASQGRHRAAHDHGQEEALEGRRLALGENARKTGFMRMKPGDESDRAGARCRRRSARQSEKVASVDPRSATVRLGKRKAGASSSSTSAPEVGERVEVLSGHDWHRGRVEALVPAESNCSSTAARGVKCCHGAKCRVAYDGRAAPSTTRANAQSAWRWSPLPIARSAARAAILTISTASRNGSARARRTRARRAVPKFPRVTKARSRAGPCRCRAPRARRHALRPAGQHAE